MKILASAAVLTALLATPAPAGDPAALILDVSGAVEPAVTLFDEIGDGTVLRLAGDTTLTISHYGACEEVALTGGTVSVALDRLLLDGSTVQSRTAVECPDRIVMAAADLVSMAVALRSARMTVTGSPDMTRMMAPAPDFVLVGEWGRSFDTLSVHGEDGRSVTVPVVGGRAAWPDDEPPLTVGETYAVVLNGPGARQHAARIEVSGEPQGMTLLKGK